MRLLVLGERAARHGLDDLLDFLRRLRGAQDPVDLGSRERETRAVGALGEPSVRVHAGFDVDLAG